VKDAVVYVVAKAPRPGEAKTRLCPPLDPADASELARAFLLDAVECARQARDVTPRIVCRDRADADEVRELVGAGIEIYCQRGSGLGAALEECFHHGRGDGFARVAVLGGDSPTLPPETIDEAFSALERADVAIGPSEDGGYYLLAARRPHPTLFRDMVWSHDGVLRETLRRCAAANLRVATLREWYDVDDAVGLHRLSDDLASVPDHLAVHSRRAIAACLQNSRS
jgi:uncharacterized protein